MTVLVRVLGRSCVLAGLLALIAVANAPARPGDADPSYSGDGFAQFGLVPDTPPGAVPYVGPPTQVGVGPDGRLVVARTVSYGYNCTRIGCYPYDYLVMLARLLPDGSLDPGFGDGGTIETDLGLSRDAEAHAYAIQPDGRILIAGAIGYSTAFVARLADDGGLDPSFDGDGVMTFPRPGGTRALALALGRAGTIVVGGSTSESAATSNRNYMVFRLLSDGTPDPAFGGGDGLVSFDFTSWDEVAKVAVDGSGRVVAVGQYEATVPFGVNTGVLRLLPDGSPDPAFSDDGFLHADLLPDRPSNEYVSGLVIDASERPVMSISAFPDPSGSGDAPYYRALVRYRENGSGDSDFGIGGRSFLDDVPGDSSQSWAAGNLGALALDSSGRFIVGGGYPFLVGRRLADGSADHSFGRDGWVRLYPRQGASASGLGLDDDGRIIVTGSAVGTASSQVARLRTDELPPDDLDADGVLDPGDRCEGVYEPGAGCPSYERSITIRRREALISGTLTSLSGGCLSGANVLLFRKRPGKDRRVGQTPYPIDPQYGSGDGTPIKAYWPAIRRPKRPGRYYGMAKASFDPAVGECGAATSRVIRLRRPGQG